MLLRLKPLIKLVNEGLLLRRLASCEGAILARADVRAAHTEAGPVRQVHLVGLACCEGAALLASVVEAAHLVLFRVL